MNQERAFLIIVLAISFMWTLALCKAAALHDAAYRKAIRRDGRLGRLLAANPNLFL